MTTKAPETIYAKVGYSDAADGVWSGIHNLRGDVCPPDEDEVAFVRADLHEAELTEARAETAAVIEAAAEMLTELGFLHEHGSTLATEVRALTPEHATAALDEIKRQAREDLAQRVALHIEAVQALGRGWPATTSGKVAAILALIENTSTKE